MLPEALAEFFNRHSRLLVITGAGSELNEDSWRVLLMRLSAKQQNPQTCLLSLSWYDHSVNVTLTPIVLGNKK